MDAYNLIISPAAKDDIKNIYDFSRLNWGETKATYSPCPKNAIPTYFEIKPV
ncbi:hypothetical protein A28LD_1602 [Idiomarina sp. A28L]|nr:hypothetical protein A28LD_1602 [Idiomarina sp. A28L]